jgi:hypothetical protein
MGDDRVTRAGERRAREDLPGAGARAAGANPGARSGRVAASTADAARPKAQRYSAPHTVSTISRVTVYGSQLALGRRSSM